jgi:hypothetical protein
MFMQKLAQSESIELIADMEAVSLLTNHGSTLIVQPDKALTLQTPRHILL